MKKIIVYFILMFSVLSGKTFAADAWKISDALEVRQLKTDCYLVVHNFPWSANSLLVRVAEGEFILADTPNTNVATGALVKWMRSQFGQFNLRVVNTHFHRDNCGGNVWLIPNGIAVWSSEKTVQLLKERWNLDEELTSFQRLNEMQLDIIKNSPLIPADHTFPLSGGITWTFRTDTVQVFWPGAAHSPDNVVVWFDRQKVLFGGCMVKCAAARTLGYLGDALVEEWPASVRKVLEKYPQAELVIPGHGRPGGQELLEHTIELLHQN